MRPRYDTAWKHVKAREWDAALTEFKWMWDATNNTESAFEPRIRGEIIASIGRIAPWDEAFRTYFVGAFDQLDARVRAGKDANFRTWIDWADLGRSLRLDDRLLALYEERRAPDGSIRVFTDIHSYAMDDVFDILLERKRFADAGRYYPDLAGQAELRFTISEACIADLRELGRTVDAAAELRSTCDEVALLHALGLAAGRTEHAERASAMVLAHDDSAASRRSLLEPCAPLSSPGAPAPSR